MENKMKKRRIALGLSQMRLSKLAGVSRFRIHLAENGYIKLKKNEEGKIRAVVQDVTVHGKGGQ